MLWGEYSGVGTFEHAFRHHGVPAAKLSEDNILKQRVLRHHFPAADLADRAGSSGSTIRAPAVLIAAGLPCQPFAPGGSKLAEHDERADGVTNDVPDAVASLGERYISVDIEEHEAFLSTGSVVLERFDARLAANHPPLVRSPSRPCLFDSAACNGKVLRPRCALRWELEWVVARIGEAPPLRPILALHSRIRDIALHDDDVRPEQYVDGVLTLVDHCVSRDHPTVAATLTFGGPNVPIREGSRVRHPSYDFELVVVSYPDDPSLPLLLMRDKRGSVAYFPNHTREEPFTNVATTFDVLSMDGIAASFTKMAISPLGSAKQLWLRNGRAYAPDYRELVRLLECHPNILFPLHVDASLRPKDVDAVVGDMLSMQLAEAQAHRSVTREGQLRTAIALDVARSRGVDSLESRAALRFAPVAYGSPHDAFVVLVIQSDDGDLRALVSNDRRQLPVIPAADKSQPSRDSIVTAATRFCASLNSNLGFDPHSFLVFSRPWLSVVACPLLGLQPGVNNEFSAWLTIDEVADRDVYLPVASAMSRVAAYCQRGMPIALADVADGAMAPRPLLALPYAPSARPSAWPAQLHYLECVDTHLRRVLTTVSRSHRHRQYLLDWVPQIDTAPNADIPPSLRGISMTADDETAFVDVPFYDPCPVQSIPKPTFPRKQHTTHKPRSIEQILYPWAIRKLAKELRPIIAIMKLDRDKLPVPDWLRAQLKTIVIGQDGFLPEARDIVWDLRFKHADGYFMPLDFEAPIDTHLHARAFFDALGDDYPDQSLRHQILNGALFFADLALQIVICPHLLSLGHAFANAENDIARLASLGYLEIVNAEHSALDDDDLIVALGLLPIRCTSQGTRAKKLKPNAPRRIANASGPHKMLSCGMKVKVLPLNEAIALRSLVNGKPKFNPERKPSAPGVMSDICVLQVPARILREPILQFNDDSSDAFNQFHLHRSQIYMTSILWLKINDIASRCEYSHILEYSLGYGFANASGFCQRFGDALLYLVKLRMRQLERPSRTAVTDTSLLEWFKHRDALGPDESDLFRMFVFTDDPHFIAVGFERLVRLLSCWRDVTLMVGLRMATAAKRQGGTSILWVGLRFHGTFGAVVIPPPKRARAIAELRRMHLGDNFTVEDAMSIAGLIEHLTPFASELRSSNYHLYYPHKAFAKLGMQYSFPPTAAMQSQARKWMERLIQRPGIACVTVRILPRETGGSVVVMSSDAAKDGTPTPGVGGHMHGMSWYLPLSPEDVAALPINWLEFLGIYGNFVIFGPSIPLMHTRVLALTDSLTSALVLSKHSAKSEGMQMIHLRLLDEAEFVRLAAITDIAHVFGPGNIFSDAVSRGYFDMVEELCRQCHTAHEWLVVPHKVHKLLADLRALARDLATRANRGHTSRPLSKKESQRSRSHRSANKGSYGPPAASQPAGQSSEEHDDRPSTAHPWERAVRCTSPGCNRACDPNLLRRGIASCCAICSVSRSEHTTTCDIVHSSSLPAFALPLRRFEPQRPRRISDAPVPRVDQLDLFANDRLPDFVAQPIVAENLVVMARGIVWDLVVTPPIVAVDPLTTDVPGGGPAMHPDADPDVLVDYDDADDNDVWAHVFGSANAAVDVVSRRPSSPTELGLDAANRGNSMGDGPTQQPTAFPRFNTPPTPRYGTPTNAPVSFVSFAARPLAPAHHVRVVRPAPTSPSAPITAPSAVLALSTNARPSPPRAANGNVARFALRRASPSAFPKFARSEPTPPPSVPRLRTPLVGPPRPPAVATVSFRSRSFAASAVTHSFHVLPPPPSGRSQPAASVEQSDAADLLALLQHDTSKYALCPGDPGMLAGLMRDVGSAVRRSVRPNTQRKDRSSWRKWVAFCRMLDTPEVRDCVDAHAGLDTSGARRERFLQAAFFLYAFRTMVPRNRAHHTAKPASARSCLDSVRRVHKHMDIVMCPAPSVALVLKGLMDEYVHLHGAEILVPKRREPLTNEQTMKLLSIATGTKLGKHAVDWSSPLFVNFAAFLTTLRHSGSRKADLLCVAPEDFDPSSMSKWNLKWFVDGEIVDCPTPEQLRNLGPGDAAIIIPGCTKADPFAVMFGDKPIYLPFHPTDPCNAAARLARLELRFPVPAAQRRHVPLFVSDAAGTPMSHAVVDAIFAAACLFALGAPVAKTLSLHSGRVWLACALLAAGHSTATIQAMCRWLSPAAVRIYAHMNPEAAMSTLGSAMSAAITSRLSSNIPPCDADSQVRAVSHSLDSPSGPAGSFCPPRPRARSAPPGSVAGSDSEDDSAADGAVGCLVAESGMCDKGAPLTPAEVKKGALVAVPFALGSHHVHYSGTISAVTSSTEVRVAFPGERPWLIARNRLFHVVSLDDTADDA